MSHDLQIISRRRPNASDLDAFRTERPDLTFDGRLKTGGFISVEDRGGTRVELDGPAPVEAEDLPDAANGATGGSGWLTQLSVKVAHTVEGWPTDLATHLARASDGVVYDPQSDCVTWPPGFQPRDAATGEERAGEVSVTWYTGWRSEDPELPRRLLRLLAAHLPDAVPKRYGGYEPLSHRFDGEDRDERFIGHWSAEASGWTPSLFWTATPPCLGGSVSMSTMQPVKHPDPGQPIVRVTIGFDSRPFTRDPALIERLVAAFRTIAAGLRSPYAAATLNRDMIMRRGRADADFRTETGPLPRTDRWIGLPAAPTWLAWFGPSYAELLSPNLSGIATEDEDDAIFLRVGTEPMHADSLADHFPPLPLELIARRPHHPPTWETRVRYTLVNSPPSEPADIVPNLADDSR